MNPLWIQLTRKGGARVPVNAAAIAWVGIDGSGSSAVHFGGDAPLLVEESPSAIRAACERAAKPKKAEAE